MSSTIAVIGVTDAGRDSLSGAALAEVEQAEVLAGGERHLAFFPSFSGEKVRIGADVPALLEALQSALDAGRRAAVLASGDPFLFGIGTTLAHHFGPGRLRVIPAASAVQLAFARVGEPWHDAAILSAHGRPLEEVLPAALMASKMAILTDGAATPSVIASALGEAGMEDCRAVVCERLGGASERIIETRLSKLRSQTFDPLNVLLLFREPARVRHAFGQPESCFEHARGQITKAEVRAVTLSKLRLRPDGVLWDIGGGSGSLAIEAARLMPRGRVYTVERDEAQRELIGRNARAHGTANVRVVAGEAPEALKSLPAPDSVFLGGSGGRLPELLEVLPRPFVANIAVVEHLALLLDRFPGAEVVQLSVARSGDLADGHRLAALNPVYIVSVAGEDSRP